MLIPLGDRLLIKRAEAKNQTAGGIYLADNAKEKPQEGSVMAIGAEAAAKEPQLAVGDLVLFGKYAGVELDVDNETVLLIRVDEALAIRKAVQDTAQTS